jgi:hypothetical protein
MKKKYAGPCVHAPKNMVEKRHTPVSMPHTPVNDEKQAKCTANSKEKS